MSRNYDLCAVLFRLLPRSALPLLALGLAAACAGTVAPTPSYNATLSTAPAASASASAGASPSTLPIPIPDIPSGEPLHGIGEPITIGDTVFTFTGLATRPDGLYATFDVQSGSLDGAQLLAGGALVPLRATADGYEAGPLNLTSDPDTGLVALVLGDAVVPLAPSFAP